MINIFFTKTHDRAEIPIRSHIGIDKEGNSGTGDSGYDLVSVVNTTIPAGSQGASTIEEVPLSKYTDINKHYKVGSAIVDVGLTVAYIQPGYWFRIEGRSGLGFKHGISPHFGIIDNGYRGDLAVKLYNFTDVDYNVSIGDRIAQIVVYPLIDANMSFSAFSISDSVSDRGDGGFGSTGK